MNDYKMITVFRGSCSSCGVFQEIEESRCTKLGCLALHHYSVPSCRSCGRAVE